MKGSDKIRGKEDGELMTPHPLKYWQDKAN